MRIALQDIHAAGRCYCGGVEFEVLIPAGESPIFTACCRCDSCLVKALFDDER